MPFPCEDIIQQEDEQGKGKGKQQEIIMEMKSENTGEHIQVIAY